MTFIEGGYSTVSFSRVKSLEPRGATNPLWLACEARTVCRVMHDGGNLLPNYLWESPQPPLPMPGDHGPVMVPRSPPGTHHTCRRSTIVISITNNEGMPPSAISGGAIEQVAPF